MLDWLKASPLGPYLAVLRVAAVVAVLGAVFGAGWTANGWRYEAKIGEQKAEAARLLKEKTDAVTALRDEREANTARANAAALEKQKEIEDAHNRNVALGSQLGAALECLRVGGRWAGDRCAVPAAGTPAGRCVSLQAEVDQLSGLVGRLAAAGNELARDADREAAVAASAHAWAVRMGFGAE